MQIQTFNCRKYLMIKINSLTKALIIASFSLAITGCGEKGLVIKNGPAGPNTGDLIDPLPDGLVPDKANSRHEASDLKPVVN